MSGAKDERPPGSPKKGGSADASERKRSLLSLVSILLKLCLTNYHRRETMKVLSQGICVV